MDVINSTDKRLVNEVFDKIPTVDRNAVQEMLRDELADLNKKIIVLDDDPTGVQTVHNISVYTDWSVDSIEKGFAEQNADVLHINKLPEDLQQLKRKKHIEKLLKMH